MDDDLVRRLREHADSLNGGEARPLTEHALKELRRIERAPLPKTIFNPWQRLWTFRVRTQATRAESWST